MDNDIKKYDNGGTAENFNKSKRETSRSDISECNEDADDDEVDSVNSSSIAKDKPVDLNDAGEPEVETLSLPKKEAEKFENDDNILLIKDNIVDIRDYLGRLEREFQSKLQYDKHKEKIIDTLHRELQDYKNDVIKKTIQQVIMDIIHTVEDMKKLINHYQAEQPVNLDPIKLLKLMSEFPSDLEDLLYKQRVEPFCCNETDFNPSCQKAVRTLKTNEKSKDKKVARSIRTMQEKWQA